MSQIKWYSHIYASPATRILGVEWLAGRWFLFGINEKNNRWHFELNYRLKPNLLSYYIIAYTTSVRVYSTTTIFKHNNILIEQSVVYQVVIKTEIGKCRKWHKKYGCSYITSYHISFLMLLGKLTLHKTSIQCILWV